MRIELIAPDKLPRQKRALSVLRSDLLRAAGGFSEYRGRGAWQDPSGKVFREGHARFDLLARASDRVIGAFRKYGRRAGERVLFALVNGRGRFIRP